MVLPGFTEFHLILLEPRFFDHFWLLADSFFAQYWFLPSFFFYRVYWVSHVELGLTQMLLALF